MGSSPDFPLLHSTACFSPPALALTLGLSMRFICLCGCFLCSGLLPKGKTQVPMLGRGAPPGTPGAGVTAACHRSPAHVREPWGVSSYHSSLRPGRQKPGGSDEEMEGGGGSGDQDTCQPTHLPVLVTKDASRAEVVAEAGARGTGDEREGPSANPAWKGALSEWPPLAGGSGFPWTPQQDPDHNWRDVLGSFYRPLFYTPSPTASPSTRRQTPELQSPPCSCQELPQSAQLERGPRAR